MFTISNNNNNNKNKKIIMVWMDYKGNYIHFLVGLLVGNMWICWLGKSCTCP